MKAKDREAALRTYGDRWGRIIRHLMKFKEEKAITLDDLLGEMRELYPEFDMSRSTLYHLLRALGFSYKINEGQRYIFERPDLIRKRQRYLSTIEAARNDGECLVYIDETWVWDSMASKRGRNDTNIPRFPSAATIQEYSCGKTSGKSRGKRGIVIGAMAEEGVIPHCSRVLISGYRDALDDYHRDMDSVVFDEWLRTSIPLMQSFANGRHVTIIMDNAPYHSRVLEKIPTASSRKQEIVAYLRSKGVEVAEDRTKAELLEELELYLRSRGGVSAARTYAVETICTDLGVAVIRLPPYHCFFNPIELCWSQLKHHLSRIGKPYDKLEIVRDRTLEWMENVPPQMCEAWYRESRREEDAARLKAIIDSNNIEESELGVEEEEWSSPSSDDLELSDEEFSDVSMGSLTFTIS